MTGVARIKALEALGRAITPPMIEGTMALFAAAACRPGAEFDPENFQRQADQVNAAHLEATWALPRMLYFTGHNHLSPALSLGGPGDDIGPSVASFIERFTRPPSR